MLEQRAGAQAPAAITTFLALNSPLLVTRVTVSPGIISVTWWLSRSVPPSFWNCSYVRNKASEYQYTVLLMAIPALLAVLFEHKECPHHSQIHMYDLQELLTAEGTSC